MSVKPKLNKQIKKQVELKNVQYVDSAKQVEMYQFNSDIKNICNDIVTSFTHTKKGYSYTVGFQSPLDEKQIKRGVYDIRFNAGINIQDETAEPVHIIRINNTALHSKDSLINALINALVELDIHINLQDGYEHYDKTAKKDNPKSNGIVNAVTKDNPLPTRHPSENGGFHKPMYQHFLKVYGLKCHNQAIGNDTDALYTANGVQFKPTRLNKTSHCDYSDKLNSKDIDNLFTYKVDNNNIATFGDDTKNYLFSVEFDAFRMGNVIYKKYENQLNDFLKWNIIPEQKEDKSKGPQTQNKITLQIQAGDNDAGLFSTVKLSTDASKSILQDLLKFSLDNKAFKMSSNEVTLKDMKFSISLVSENEFKSTPLSKIIEDNDNN